MAPIGILVYCYSNLVLEREELQINNALLPAGSFERQACLTADPAELFLFRTSFDSLRILSMTDFLLRIVMNLSFCNRFKRVVEVHILAAQHRRSRFQAVSVVPQKRVLRIVALAFALFGVAVLVVTHKAMVASVSLCAAFPECVAYAHRWTVSDSCPCLILVDTDKMPRTYEAWINTVDKTETVRELSRSGDLRVLQLINRRVQVLPDELQRCVNIKHMYVCLLSWVHTVGDLTPT